jgi:hypothetical protein
MRSPRHNTSFEIPNQVGKRLHIRTDLCSVIAGQFGHSKSTNQEKPISDLCVAFFISFSIPPKSTQSDFGAESYDKNKVTSSFWTLSINKGFCHFVEILEFGRFSSTTFLPISVELLPIMEGRYVLDLVPTSQELKLICTS